VRPQDQHGVLERRIAAERAAEQLAAKSEQPIRDPRLRRAASASPPSRAATDRAAYAGIRTGLFGRNESIVPLDRSERRLPLPAGGTQLFHRVALDTVGRAIAAALARGPHGVWAANVGDAQDLTFGGLASLVAARLDWRWEPEEVAWDAGDHPWNVRHPVLMDTSRLRNVLGVVAPDGQAATQAQIDWLWEHRQAAADFTAA
jgi:hypothetical protein